MLDFPAQSVPFQAEALVLHGKLDQVVLSLWGCPLWLTHAPYSNIAISFLKEWVKALCVPGLGWG